MLGRACDDPNPEMKSKGAQFAAAMCRDLRKETGHFMRSTVVALTSNLQHQHSKVRKVTLKSLEDIIIANGAEAFLIETFGQLRYTMNDRSQDVRKMFYTVLQSWMTKMELTAMRQYEHHFIIYLLNGLSDDCPEINAECREFLEVHGTRMKETLQALGKEEAQDEEMKTEGENENEEMVTA